MPFQNDIQNQGSGFNPFVYKIPLVRKELYANDGVYTYTSYSLYEYVLHNLVSLPIYSKPAHR